MRRLILLFALGGASGCEIADCEPGASSMGGVCFPDDLAAATAPPAVCGNGICERIPNPKESAESCAADCDPGPVQRANMLWYLSTRFYNAHVANKSWPGGMVDARGACDAGTGSARGPIGRTGDDTFLNLVYGFDGCAASLSVLGRITATGQGLEVQGTFNNARMTSSYRFRGMLTLSGTDGETPYGPTACAIDFTRVTTSTSALLDGSLCGKPLRRVVKDDPAR